MASGYIEDSTIVVNMTKALDDLEDIDDTSKRAACYMTANIDPAHIHRLDRFALYYVKVFRKTVRSRVNEINNYDCQTGVS